mmetsp:Transcript_37721/g.93382  ORF Transcript_37721/g.93382 Transcript_37721/m.93382 type:complete len:203 (-) Transcript_37721:1465-2073(-)
MDRVLLDQYVLALEPPDDARSDAVAAAEAVLAFLSSAPGSQLSPLDIAPIEAILLICAAVNYALVHPMLSWGHSHVGLNFDQLGARVLEHLARITEAGINPLAPGGIFATVHARLDAAGHYLDLIDIMVHDFCDHFGGYMSDSLDYILRAPWLHAFLMDNRHAQPAAKALVQFYSPPLVTRSTPAPRTRWGSSRTARCSRSS